MINFFEIKSAQLPLMSLIIKTPDFKTVVSVLLQCYGPGGNNPDFFNQDAIIIDCVKNKIKIGTDDLLILIEALHDCRLKPVAFRDKSVNENQAALSLGLVIAAPENKKNAPGSATVTPRSISLSQEANPQMTIVSNLIVDKPIRSGQKVYACGTDLVVLAMVNPGGEVVADGNIHVYAPLRGKVMAGANGNVNARIFSTCLEPELISIAGVYRTSENPLEAEIHGKAAQVFLSNDGQENLIFKPLKY